ncbi:MAG: Maf family protein, partial [Komagataeibacter saccharivorans]|uniref:Maf family protein n=1 Tax=Komagataeibacter saccharivorans TaxID=265959 RepID=UPI0039E953D3
MPGDSNLVLKTHPLQAESPPIVLASRSAARRALLESAGLLVTCRAAEVDEHAIRQHCRAQEMDASQTALELARAKAGGPPGGHRGGGVGGGPEAGGGG